MFAIPVVALALTGGAWLAAAGGDGEPGPGPLNGADEFLESQPVPANEPYDMASLATFFDNRGEKPITIERARLLGVAGPLELIEVRAHPVNAYVEGREVWGGGIVAISEARFPTDPFAGHNTVPVPKVFSQNGNPDEGLQLLFRVVMKADGVGRWSAMEIEYRAGTTRHREVFPWKVWLCAPIDPVLGKGKTPCPKDAPFGDGVLEASAGEPAG